MEPRLFDLDFQLLADSVLTIIAVFVLFLALSYLLFNPARKFMQKRQEKIAGELDHAKAAEQEALQLKAQYEEKLAGVESQADEILSAARARAMANEADIVERAREEAARIIARARVEADLEKQKAADEIKCEMIGLAMDAAEKFVRVSMDEKTKNALIDETLAEIGENTWLS
ncbi:MAG: F0F1 ATP synthase subunit B [Eubacteriales bacterium]|nr:F0F1 ATP synthase subunit B [Eubacteriales bacterium]